MQYNEKCFISCIYVIESLSTKKIYVGSTVRFNKRIKQHLNMLVKNKHHSCKLQRHVNKYGLEDLIVKILEEVPDKNELIISEQKYIDSLKPFFNIAKIAGSMLGFKFSEESIEKLRKSHLGHVNSEETRRKISDYHKGRPKSEQHKANLVGKGWVKGSKHTDEVKVIIKEKRKNQIFTAETRVKLSKFQKSKKNSEETKIKCSLTKMGKKNSPEHIDNVSKALKGRKPTEETRAKLRYARAVQRNRRLIFNCETNNIKYNLNMEDSIGLDKALKMFEDFNHKIGNTYRIKGDFGNWQISYYPIFQDGKTNEYYDEPRALVEKKIEGGIDFREIPLRYISKW